MRKVLNASVVAVLIVGLLGHILMQKNDHPLFPVVLMILAVLIAITVGIYWASIIADAAFVKPEVIDGEISALLAGHLSIVQASRPRVSILDARGKTRGDILIAIGQQFSSFFMLTLTMLGLFGIAAPYLFSEASNDLFGSFLNTEFGRAASVLFGQYLVMSAGGFVSAGIRLRFI